MNINILCNPGDTLKFKNGRYFVVDRIVVRKDGIFYLEKGDNRAYSANSFEESLKKSPSNTNKTTKKEDKVTTQNEESTELPTNQSTS